MIAEEKDDSKQTPSKVTQHVIKAVTFAQSMQKHQNAQLSRGRDLAERTMGELFQPRGVKRRGDWEAPKSYEKGRKEERNTMSTFPFIFIGCGSPHRQ